MWPYCLLFLLPAAWTLSRLRPLALLPVHAPGERWSDLWRMVFVFLVLMIGLRYQVGGDWITYIEHVNRATSLTISTALKEKDPAYGVLNWVAAQSGLGVYLVNSICAALFTWGLLAFCRAQPRPWLALVVAVPYLIMVVAMGYTRQGVAIGLAMMAMVALGQGSVLRFVVWIGLAAVFHKSAVMLVPLAVLASSQRRVFTLLWVAVAAALLFGLLLQESVEGLTAGYIGARYESSGAGIRIAMNALPAALFLVLRKRFQLPPAQLSFWTWMAWGALLFVVLLKVSPSSTAVDRVALYWIPLQLFVWSRLPEAMGPKKDANAIWVFGVVAYSAAVMFVWLVYADTAFAWLPYQFYPWVWLWQ